MPAHPPPPAAVRDLLADLVQRTVTVVTSGSPQELDQARKANAAVYRHDDGNVAAVAVADLQLSVATAAALGGVSEAGAQPSLRGGELTPEFSEVFHEVVNIAGRLLNTSAAAHVALDAVHSLPGPVPADAAALLRVPAARVDYEVVIDGYEPGIMTWLCAGPAKG